MNDEDKNSGMGFFKEPILGELTCQTCQYQCYGSTKMLKHIKTKHFVNNNFESSSRNPEGMNEDYQNNSKVSENESKNDGTSNVDEQINNSTMNKNKNCGMGFFKDPILGELTCQTCQYQCYGSTKMLKHIKNKHLVISNFESSSRNPEDYQNNSNVSENESKNDSTSNVDEQINNSAMNDKDKNSCMGFFK